MPDLTISTDESPAPTPDQLRDVVKHIDNLSQDGFSEISAIAQLALAWLEVPAGYRRPDVLAHALSAIFAKAEDVQDSINHQAGLVRCGYVDEAQLRRWDAKRAARELDRSHA